MRPYTPTGAMRHDDDDELDIDRGKCSHEYPPKIKINYSWQIMSFRILKPGHCILNVSYSDAALMHWWPFSDTFHTCMFSHVLKIMCNNGPV